MKYPRIGPGRAGELARRGWRIPLSDRRLSYPAWYLQRWHFLPDGYMSRGSAWTYDAVIPPLYNLASEQGIHERIVDVLVREGVERVLDAGCGTGRFLARAQGRIAEVTGIDLSPYMLERAARRMQPGGSRLLHADAARWIPGGFDAAVAMHVLGHLPLDVARRVAANMARAVLPGGLLVLVEHRWHRVPVLPSWLERKRVQFGPRAVEMKVYRTSSEVRDVADFGQPLMEHAL